MKELKVGYSVGMKVDLGGFENVTFSLSREETYDVSDMTPAEANSLFDSRKDLIEKELGEFAADKYKRVKNEGDI